MTDTTPPRRVLIVCPAFHGYGESLAAALREAGHDTLVHHYDERIGLRAKAVGKIAIELPERLGSPVGTRMRASVESREAIAALRAAAIDVVIVVRGDSLSDEFWEEAARSDARIVLWLYDPLRRMWHGDDVLRSVDTLITYSRGDADLLRARGIDAHYVPNAFDARTGITAPETIDAVTFIGARHPGREATLMSLHAAAVPVLAVGRDWSHHPLDRLRTWDPRRPTLPAMRDVSRQRAYGLMAGSACSLNVHEVLEGFTMRTFEICGVGGVQLVDRPDVDEFYDPGSEVITYASEDELIEAARRALRDPAWGGRLRVAARRRTLAEHTFLHRVRALEQVWG